MKSILVVFNNNSGRRKISSCIRFIYNKFKEENLNFKFIYIDVLPFLKDLNKYETIIVVGGDGSVNSVLPYVINTDKILGIIPLGTANLLAANLSIPKDFSKALDIILNSKCKIIDAAKAGDKYFVLRLGFGYDAAILKGASGWLKEKFGYFAYVFNGVIKAFTLKNSAYEVKLDDKNMSVNAGTIIVANAGNMFKNLFTIAPKGKLNDGKLDIFFIKHVRNVFDVLTVFLRVVFNIHIQDAQVAYAQASNICVKTNNKYLHIDGETFNGKDNLNIQVIPQSIKVFAP